MINTTICAHKIEDLEGAPDSNLWMDSTHNSRNLVHGPRGVGVCVCLHPFPGYKNLVDPFIK